MGLISYSQLQDGTEAVANDLNNRFGAIYNEFNGNIDAANLKNSAVTREKIADNSITKDKLALRQYIDDNGWTVTDMGGIKTYSRTVPVTGTQNDHNGPGHVGLLIEAGGRRAGLGSFPAPVGRTIDNIIVTCTYFGHYSGHLVVNGEKRDGKIFISGGNIFPWNLSFDGEVHVQVTEKL